MTSPAPSRRGILALLATIPTVALPAMPALAAAPSLTAMPGDQSWKNCVADYRAAEAALEEAELQYETIAASCKAAYNKLSVPPGLRSPFLKQMGWLDMSLEELRADIASGCPGTDAQKAAVVERDMRGVPEFKAEQARVMAPKDAAWEAMDAASARFSEAEDKLRDFKVANIVDLAEKMAIARETENDWIMEGAHADIQRIAG
jgi:hypothetical protein